MPTRKPKPKAKAVTQGNPWEAFPGLDHMRGEGRVMMEYRRRHRAIRYGLFRLKNALEAGRDPIKELADVLGKDADNFANYWLQQMPEYAVEPGAGGQMRKVDVPANKIVPVEKLGGYLQFAKVWDVDPNLKVYIRFLSVWQEWNATLMRVVPILGEE